MHSPEAREATAALVGRDRALPLDVLLDDDVLSDWLTAATGSTGRVRRRYLRYKPGTSCTVLVERECADAEPELVVVAGYTTRTRVKLDKTMEKVGAETVVASDTGRGLLALAPTGDRHVRAVRALLTDTSAALRPALGGAVEVDAVRTLAYKPHRRWVGQVTTADATLLVRAYRSGQMRGHAHVLQSLQRGDLAVSRVRGTSARHDLLVCDWADGDPADALLVGHHADEPARAELRRVGAVLAQLHARDDVAAPASDTQDTDAPGEVVGTVTAVLPEVAPQVERLAGAVRDALRRSTGSPRVLAHGDFSLDQVVLGADGPVLLDLDHAGTAPAAADLGSLVATVLADPARAGAALSVLQALSTGYADRLEVPADAEVATHAAAHLLRRAAEPFRRGEADWTGALTRSLDLVDLLLQDGLGALAQVQPATAAGVRS